MTKISFLSKSVLAGSFLAGSLFSSAPANAAESLVSVQTKVDRPILSANGGRQDVVIQLKVGGGKIVSPEKRPPLNVAVVLDRSSSMKGKKLQQAKTATHSVIEKLGPNDNFSLISYSDEARVMVPSEPIGNRKKFLRRQVDRLNASGYTALYAGVEMGGEQVEEWASENKISRVILLSDGQANRGPTSHSEISQLGVKLAKKGISVTTIGLGDGFNEQLMAALANASDANYYYVADVEDLDEIFRSELGELQSIVARDLKIKIELPKGVSPIRLIGSDVPVSENLVTLDFNTLSSEQQRNFLLQCTVDPKQANLASTLADVQVTYATADGAATKEANNSPLLVTTNDNEEIAAAAEDKEIRAQAIVFENRARLTQAVAQNDKGDTFASRQILDQQSAVVGKALAAAPASSKPALREELNLLRKAKSQIESTSGLKKRERKSILNRLNWQKSGKDIK